MYSWQCFADYFVRCVFFLSKPVLGGCYASGEFFLYILIFGFKMLVSFCFFKVMGSGERDISVYLNQNHIYYLQNSVAGVWGEDVTISWFVPLGGFEHENHNPETTTPWHDNGEGLLRSNRGFCAQWGSEFCFRTSYLCSFRQGTKLVRQEGKVWKYKETMRGLSEESIIALSGNLVLRRCLR